MSDGIGCVTGQNGSGDLLTCAAKDIVAPAGEPLTALLFGGAILMGLYLAGDGDIEVPALVLILLGGTLIPVLPAGYSSMAMTIMLLGFVSGMLALARRYVLGP